MNGSQPKDVPLGRWPERYKSKRIHRIPLCPMAQAQVDAALRLDPKSSWLFPSLGAFGPRSGTARMNERSLTEAMVRLVQRLKIDHATPHTLRHTVGSHLDRLGFELNEIGLALGHRARGVTAGYVHDLDGRFTRPAGQNITHPFGAVGARSPVRRATRAQRGMGIPLVSQSELVSSVTDAWRSITMTICASKSCARGRDRNGRDATSRLGAATHFRGAG
jgi:Phage integrase family